MSGSLSNSSGKVASAAPPQRRLSVEPRVLYKTPLRSEIPKNLDTIINTWPIVKDRYKTCLAHSEGLEEMKGTPKHAESERLLSNSVRQLRSSNSRLSLDRRLLPYAESRRTDFGHGHVKEKPLALNTPMRESRSAIGDFTAKLERLAAEQSRPRSSRSGTQLPWKSRTRSLACDEGEGLLAEDRLQLEEDLGKLDLKLGNQFERLFSAIDGVTKQVQTAFEGLHQRVDGLQASLEADYVSGWKKLKDHLDQQGTPKSGVRQRGAHLARSADSLDLLQQATETAREDIRILTGLLIVEKDADLMLARDFQDRQAMLLKMLQPYLKKPAFEQFWHIKHGLDHCVASVLFKTSNILARTQSMMGFGPSRSKFSAGENDDAQFKRFCRKGQRGLEAIADWAADKWSVQLKKEFLNACKGVWQLQSMVATTMISHQVEFLRPEPGSELDEAIMDSLDVLSEDRFHPLVQFTIFPGFKIEGIDIIKSQVYLQPKCAVVTGS